MLYGEASQHDTASLNPQDDDMLPLVPIIDNENWIVPAGSNPDLKRKALIRNISNAVDNQVNNMVAQLINEYNQIQEKQYQDVNHINSELDSPDKFGAENVSPVRPIKQDSKTNA